MSPRLPEAGGRYDENDGDVALLQDRVVACGSPAAWPRGRRDTGDFCIGNARKRAALEDSLANAGEFALELGPSDHQIFFNASGR
jgi:hypothetical protein